MIDIRNCSLEDLKSFCQEQGLKSYRASQILEWIYKKNIYEFGKMKNLPKEFRSCLEEKFFVGQVRVAKEQISKDKTKKFLFEFDDGQRVESVVIPAYKRSTVCVSSQAGCRYACRFCASGLSGWQRNLTSAEMLSQIQYAKQKLGKQRLSHVVFMGTGEPLDNYEEVMKAVKVINAPWGLSIAARHITISTCGLLPQIKRLSGEGLQLELSISLHGFDDASRNHLMPINKKYPLKQLLRACKDYIGVTNRQITFEYLMISDLTVTKEAAKKLVRLLQGLLCKVNLIPYNSIEEFPYRAPSRREVFDFKKVLDEYSVKATIRVARGQDIAAACGQLRYQDAHGK